MKRFLLSTGVVMGLLVPTLMHAAPVTPGNSIFDLFYNDAKATQVDVKPPKIVIDYIISEMRQWDVQGIVLTESDILQAIAGGGGGLCQSKVDSNGQEIAFLQGGPGSCEDLRASIMHLLTTELENLALETDLMSLANGAELAIADEPNRPINMALYALLLRRVWSGTGASVIPWDGTADDEVGELQSHLQGATPEDLNRAVLRFRYGYFRDQRENDPRFNNVMDNIGEDLSAIADKLSITGDPNLVGVFAVPKLNVPNVGLWAREDDIGLMWVYPIDTYRMKIEPADDYPEYPFGGEVLAYPYQYTGNSITGTGTGLVSPTCSGMVGRQGYLCRPQSDLQQNCENDGDPAKIVLKKCSEEVTETSGGPDVCAGYDKLFDDTGQPLVDPDNPGRLNPNLEPADTLHICTPEERILYQDDITSHACYIGHCLLQSMSGHTLVPNRSPVVVNEATSPYLACVRPDPQLGLYTEIAEDSPYPLPEYLGQFLVRDFERQFCIRNGDAPQPLLGLCAFNNNENAALPLEGQLSHAITTTEVAKALQMRGTDFQSIAGAIGQRVALDQTIELERKTFARLAHFIQHIADLIMELERAPMTQSACPWTGPFKKE